MPEGLTPSVYPALDCLAGVVVVSNMAGRIVHVNRAVEPLLGYRPEDLVGQALTLIVPPRLRGPHLAAFDRFASTGVPTVLGHPLQVPAQRRDGTEIEIELILSAGTLEGEDVVVGLLHARMQRDEGSHHDGQLQFQLDFMAAIMSNLSEGVYALDRAGKLTYMNPSAERLLGWQAEELLGKDMHQAVHFRREDGAFVPPADCKLLQVIQLGETYQSDDDVFVRKDGSLLPVGYTSSPIITDGEVAGAVLSFYDRTAQRELEREKDFVLSALAHDLRSPLTSIQGFAQLLLRRARRTDTLTASDITGHLQRIESTSKQVAGLIDELMDIARIRMNSPLELVLRPTDLVTAVREVIAWQQEAIEDHPVDLQVQVPELIGEWDATRLQRAISNLVSNAAKYSPAGSEITVTVTEERDGDLPFGIVRVSDRGIGIPEADLPYIFERFRRGTNVVGQVPGTGIGLAAVRYIVESMGGRVDVTSRQGEGSTFSVRLPIRTTVASETAATAE